MKKGLLVLLSVFMLVVVTACREDPDPESITLDPAEVTVGIDETVTVTATVEPEDADQDVTWESADTTVATVVDGEITGVAIGTTTITVTSLEDETVTASLSVEVTPPAAEMTIEDVWALDDGDDADTIGTITAITDHRTFFIEDDTRAIAVYDGEEDYIGDLNVGDLVRVQGERDGWSLGWWDSDYNLEQIGSLTDVTVYLSDQDLPGIVDIQDVDWGDEDAMIDYQGHRVSATGLVVTGVGEDEHGNINFDVTHPDTAEEVRIRYDSRLPDSEAAAAHLLTFEEGDLVDLVGITLGWFDGPQFLYSDATQVVESDEELAVSIDNLPDEDVFILPGETYQLEPTIVPPFAPDGFTFESDDEDKLTVDENGLVTAVEAGAVTVTVTSVYDTDVYVEVVFEVSERMPATITGPDSFFWPKGDAFDVDDVLLFVTAEDDVDGDITDEVEIYDDGGFDYETEADYEVVLKVENTFGLETYFTVTIRVQEGAPDLVEGITGPIDLGLVQELPLGYEEEEEGMITWAISPGFIPQDVTFEDYDEDVLTVDENGLITTVGVGETTINIVSVYEPSIYFPFHVEVVEPALAALDMELILSETGSVTKAITPDLAAGEYTFEFSIDDDTIAEVDAEGNVTAYNIGTAEITVTAKSDDYPDLTTTLDVTVVEPEIHAPEAVGITLYMDWYAEQQADDDPVDLYPDTKSQLSWTVGYEGFWAQGVTFESDDEDVVTVDKNGMLTAHEVGSATITITSKYKHLSDVSTTVEVEVVNPVPRITLPGRIQVLAGEETIESLLDMAVAYDYVDGDITDDITVVDDDGFETDVFGDYEIQLEVTNSLGETTTVIFHVGVVEENPTTFPSGYFNFRLATSDMRHALFAYAERYLMETMYGGIPVFANAGFNMYSHRLELPVDDYIPVMGYGTSFADMSEDDSTVIMDHGDYGNVDEYTYRGRLGQNPSTLHQWIYDDATSSDVITIFMDALYAFVFNEDKTGYEVVPSMAADDPDPQNLETLDTGREVATIWQIEIRDDLKWSFHEDLQDQGYTEEITAQDFVDTYKLALDQGWFRAIAGGGDFTSTPQEIVNAQAYYDDEVEWEDVGINLIDEYTIEFEFVNPMGDWDVRYWLSSFVMTPIHLELYDDVGDQYGTSEDTVAAHGPYVMTYYEPDSIIRYEANPNYHAPERYNFTHRTWRIIEDAEIAFEEFLHGTLEAAGVPGARYEQFQHDPRIRHVPGATTFRIMINGLGTVEKQTERFPNSTWNPEPLLANDDFKLAMFYAIDRDELTSEVMVTSEPNMYYFSEAYMVEPEEGVAFRHHAWGDWVGEGLGRDTHGYVPDRATALWEDAISDLIEAGDYDAGTAGDPTVINLMLNVFSGSESQLAFGEYIKDTFEDIFVSDDHHIKVEVEVRPRPFPDIYYNYMMIGDFDLSIGGISGSTIDAASFLYIFCDDNRGGFTLNWGIDTTTANIQIYFDDDDNVVMDAEDADYSQMWSFNALVSVLNGRAYIQEGEEIPTAEWPVE